MHKNFFILDSTPQEKPTAVRPGGLRICRGCMVKKKLNRMKKLKKVS